MFLPLSDSLIHLSLFGNQCHSLHTPDTQYTLGGDGCACGRKKERGREREDGRAAMDRQTLHGQHRVPSFGQHEVPGDLFRGTTELSVQLRQLCSRLGPCRAGRSEPQEAQARGRVALQWRGHLEPRCFTFARDYRRVGSRRHQGVRRGGSQSRRLMNLPLASA